MITALVVTHNSESCIRSCLSALARYVTTIIVIDNASKDGTLAHIADTPNIHILQNKYNKGFAAAVNQAAALAQTPYLLLLNPDTELLTPLDPLLTRIGENRHTAAAGLLLDPAGNPQKGFTFRRLPTPAALAFEVLGMNRLWPTNPVNIRYRCLDADLSTPQTIEQPAGAFLLLRTQDFLSLGGLDEQFHPVWFEDVDLCSRLLKQDGKIWFDPSVRAKHLGGHSVQKIELGHRTRFWYASLLKYAAKHFAPLPRRIVALAVLFALPLRACVGMLGNPSSTVVTSHIFIWQSAWRCFWTGRVNSHGEES
jgi:N-acetylglucosaminyl-diphospho-decaprenol L-rhamnosyltransferase